MSKWLQLGRGWAEGRALGPQHRPCSSPSSSGPGPGLARLTLQCQLLPTAPLPPLPDPSPASCSQEGPAWPAVRRWGWGGWFLCPHHRGALSPTLHPSQALNGPLGFAEPPPLSVPLTVQTPTDPQGTNRLGSSRAAPRSLSFCPQPSRGRPQGGVKHSGRPQDGAQLVLPQQAQPEPTGRGGGGEA